MAFDPAVYGERVAAILELGGRGNRPMPLVSDHHPCPDAAALLWNESPASLFPNAPHPAPAMAGLWLYFSGFEEAHQLTQDDGSAEGSLWHAILHRQEPDSGNSAYWYRRAGHHATHPALTEAALEIVRKYPDAEFRPSMKWDPFGFINFCERARQQPGSASEKAALEIQLAEWQILFDYCVRGGIPKGKD